MAPSISVKIVPIDMAHRVAVKRIVCSVIAVLLLAVAVVMTLDYRRGERAVRECSAARPMTATVDLSKPGRFTIPFKQTFSMSHGEAMYLDVSPSVAGRETASLLEGFEGTFTIADARGTEVLSAEFPSDFPTESSPGEPIRLLYFHPFAEGKYVLTVDVTSAAETFDGARQEMFAKYELCGLERMPAMISAAIALVCAIPATVLGVFVILGFAKHGIRVREASDA